MAKKQFDFSDTLASSMDSIMSDPEYQSIFDAPKVAFATDNENDIVRNAVQTLLLTSNLLEELNLQKSSAKTLETVNILISEAMEKGSDEDEADDEADDEDEACADDKDEDAVEDVPPGI